MLLLSNSRAALLSVLTLTSLTAFVAVPAHAQVVFDNGGPARVNGYANDPDSGFFQNDTFTFTGGTTFDTVQWWGTYAFANTPPATDNFTVTLHNTTNGTPDTTPFATFTLGNTVIRTPDGVSASGGTNFFLFRYTASLSALTLGPGTYGISIVNDTASDTDDNWYWETSTVLGSHYSRSSTGAYTSANENLAFNLQNSTAATAVPEPGEWAIMGMLGTSVCGLMVRARRKASTTGKKALATS